jgi:hypothetical protein
MLTTRERLEQRRGLNAAPRHEYLQQLVDEYQRSPQLLRKEEIAANLANFCYDPINYGSLARLRVMDLFLDILDADQEEEQARCDEVRAKRQSGAGGGGRRASDSGSDERGRTLEGQLAAARAATSYKKYHLVEFALGGISNCVADPTLQRQFLDGEGLEIVMPHILRAGAHPGALATPSELNAALSALTIAYFLLDSPAAPAVASGPCRAHLEALERHPERQVANLAAAVALRRQELAL